MNRPTTTASNLFRRSLCAGSARLEEGLPDEENELSHEGEMLHWYYAHKECQRSVLIPNQRDLLERADELTNEAIEACKQEIRVATFKDYQETTLSMLGTYGMGCSATKDVFTGTPDLARYYLPGEAAIILDLKFGYLNVESADLNLQLRSYAVLSYDFSPTKVIYVGIIQPRAPKGEQLTLAKYLPEDIEDARQQIISILKASEKPDAPLVPGESQCRYCKARLICPAFQKAMTITLPLTPDKALSKAAREAYFEQQIALCDDVLLENLHDAVSLAAMIKDPLRDEERKRIQAGGYSNFKLGKETEVREVTDVRKAIALLSLAGLDKDTIYSTVHKISLTDLGEELRKLHPTWDWKQVRDWINQKLKSVIATDVRKPRILRK